ncbi:MAG TPA: hypothetical protein VM183_14580 [Burkholderiales bacterium]|nr:hypothetical protein [Burkholderiales bacterium]
MTGALFVIVVLSVAALFAYAGVTRARSPAVVAVVLLFYLVVPAVLASQGVLDRYSPFPPPGFILGGLITLCTLVLAFSAFGSRLATGVPLAALVGFQVFRVPLEWVLHRLYSEGVIPVQMTYAGQNFDIVSGVLAAALALWLWTGRRSVRLVAAWNIIGLVLLATIVGIAILSSPVPFRQFMNDPPNLLPSTLPYVWLPTFLVQAALFGHLLVFRAIRVKRAAAFS